MLQDKIVVWIAGGSFGSADPRNYLSFGQQILGSEPGADVYLIGCRAKPDAPNTYPHIHEHCSSVVYSIVSEVAPDRLISRKVSFAILVILRRQVSKCGGFPKRQNFTSYLYRAEI